MDSRRLKQNIEEYTRRYCIKHEVSPDEAITHSMVRYTTEYYEEQEKDKVDEPVITGCSCELEDKSC